MGIAFDCLQYEILIIKKMKTLKQISKEIFDELTFSWRLEKCVDSGCSKGCCPALWEEVTEKDAERVILPILERELGWISQVGGL